MDLFGPLKTETGKKFVLCMTDAFSKYVEIVANKNKEAETVAEAEYYCNNVAIISRPGKYNTTKKSPIQKTYYLSK